MSAVTFDPSREIDLYFRVARAGSKTLIFVDENGDDFDIESYTFELLVKDYYGGIVMILTEGSGLEKDGNELEITVTESNTDLNVSEYYWQLNVTSIDKTWLNGKAFFHTGVFDGVTETTTVTVIENGETVTVTISGALPAGNIDGGAPSSVYTEQNLDGGTP